MEATMSSKTKADKIIDSVICAIDSDINDHQNTAWAAMNTLEKFNATPEEFKKANITFALNSYVVNYLNRIKSVVMERDLKKAENIIRYHSFNQHAKGNLDDGSTISVAQATVAVILSYYIANFFEA